jgi:hypothetical protein
MNEASNCGVCLVEKDLCFNPLFIGSMNEADEMIAATVIQWLFQSPFHRVNE